MIKFPPSILAGALLASLAFSGAHAATQVVVAQPADIRSTNPGVNRDNSTDGVVLSIVEGLVGYRENGTVAPLLAESVTLSDDKLTYTFKLRDGVKFHNGAVLTSADVMWNWTRYMDPKTDWRCLSEYDGRNNGLKVESVSAPDARTFVMKINRPSAIFMDSLARTDCAMTAIIHKDSVKADGSWDKPIGTGPFKLAEWKRGEYVTLDAFKDYVSPKGDKPDGYVGAKQPKVDQIKFLVVPDPSTVKAGLLSGAIDAAQVTNTDVVELKASKNVQVQVPVDAVKHSLLFQTNDPVMKNEKLRQAIAASLDIPQIVAAASDGLGHVNNSAIHTGSAFYSNVQKQAYKYDPAKAQQLLKESGYKNEKIVIYANKRAHVPSYSVAVLAQAMMQAVGINAQIEVLEWATQLDRYNRGNYQISSFSYSSRLDPALSYEQFAGPKAEQPRKVWDDPQAQKLIDESFAESDPAKRQALFDQLHTLMLKQTPLLVLFNGADSWGVNSRIKGFSVWEGKPRVWETSLAK